MPLYRSPQMTCFACTARSAVVFQPAIWLQRNGTGLIPVLCGKRRSGNCKQSQDQQETGHALSVLAYLAH